jgi:uncharacterized cupredoxin-like copper-binding protein
MKALLSLLASLLCLTAQAHEHTHGQTDDIGSPGSASKVDRVVNVVMTDNMRFTPSSVTVKEGETIRFIVKNAGKLKHEFVLGTEAELAAHAEAMKKFPDMQHSDPNMVTLAGGKTGQVLWRFSKAGSVAFACLEAGHYDAGMKGAVDVMSRPHAEP